MQITAKIGGVIEWKHITQLLIKYVPFHEYFSYNHAYFARWGRAASQAILTVCEINISLYKAHVLCALMGDTPKKRLLMVNMLDIAQWITVQNMVYFLLFLVQLFLEIFLDTQKEGLLIALFSVAYTYNFF